jgi:chalcone isomerase-like protein
MKTPRLVFAAIVGLSVSALMAGETVGVTGSDVQYPTTATASIGDKKYPEKLSGVAMRKRAIFNVYTIGSYVSTDFTGRTAEELASCDQAKQLHLVLQRNVSGADMAKAFEEAIRSNHPNEFTAELGKLSALIKAHDVKTGDHVWITHVPGYGLHIHLVGKTSEFIPGLKFARAVWEIYLGPKNIGEAVKQGLVSRL